MTNAEPKIDELIHAPTRLSIVALLAASKWADFKFVRDSVGLSDSALSKQIHTLERAGYVTIDKTGTGRRRRTSMRLSKRGRDALDTHVAALQAILNVAPDETHDDIDTPAVVDT